MRADYEVNGQILIIPLNGKGKAKFDLGKSIFYRIA